MYYVHVYRLYTMCIVYKCILVIGVVSDECVQNVYMYYIVCTVVL